MTTGRLYGLVWRWHFIAGVLAFPVIFVVALTGAVYTFQPELDRLTHQGVMTVEPQAEPRATYDVLMAAAARACPSRGILVPHEAYRAITVFCDDDREAYLDPYTAALLGVRDVHGSFFGIVFDLHWDLMLGEPGRLVIEWATSWSVLLMLSGLVLWWPRGRRRAGGVWWPRRGVGTRQLLRDLHAVSGAYLLPVLLALAATGLCWTLMAGDKRWRPLADEGVRAEPRSNITVASARIGYDAAFAVARTDRRTDELAVYLGRVSKGDDPYTFFVYDESWTSVSASWSSWIDAYSGRELRVSTWDSHSAIGKVNETLYPIHIGAILGLPGRIAACLGALVLAALCVTGPWMWWKRRPRGELGVPPRKRTPPSVLLAVLAAIGWLLPLVGVTLLAVLLFEGARWWLVSRRARSLP